MTILDIIEKKRDKKELTKEEIEFFINGYTNGTITDYQAAALIMAIFINGMTDEETVNLTIAMAHSGEILDLSKLNEECGLLECELGVRHQHHLQWGIVLWPFRLLRGVRA